MRASIQLIPRSAKILGVPWKVGYTVIWSWGSYEDDNRLRSFSLFLSSTTVTGLYYKSLCPWLKSFIIGEIKSVRIHIIVKSNNLTSGETVTAVISHSYLRKQKQLCHVNKWLSWLNKPAKSRISFIFPH